MGTGRKLAAAVAAIAAFGAATPAAQADVGLFGTVCDPAYVCSRYAGDFSGGKLSVDFDGRGNVSYRVWVFINEVKACELPSIYGEAPPGSWTCHNMPAGSVRAESNSYPNAAYHDLGVRLYQ